MAWKSAILCLLPIVGCGLLREYRPRQEEDRLLYYSLKPITSEEQLKELFSLSGQHKQAWLKQFWKDADPTPTTEYNERKVEHERRVAYALEHFATRFWGRPWDDRGDIYIKLGDPEDRDVRVGSANSEVWYYSDNGELVLQFDEEALEDYYHLFGNVRLSRSSTGTVPRGHLQSLLTRAAIVEADVQTVKPRYDYDLDLSLPYYCEFPQFRGEQERTRVELLYATFIEQLEFSDGWGEIEVRIKVYDRSYHEVAGRVAQERIARNTLGDGGLLIGGLDFSVPPGDYRLGMRIQDLKSRSMGILKSEFTARDFSGLSLSDLSLDSPIRLVPKKGEASGGEPSLDRVFTKSEKIVLRYEIYNLAKSPNGTTWYETEYLMKAHRRGVGDVSSTFEGSGDSREVEHRLRMDLSASPPGDYDIVLTVRDMIGKDEARASVSLTLLE